MFRVYSFDRQVALSELLKMDVQLLESQWNGEKSSRDLPYLLVVDPRCIYLFGFWQNVKAVPDSRAGTELRPYSLADNICESSVTSADKAKDLQRGSFMEGLWEREVLELFLKDDKTDAYQEFNLSPQGAWWSAYFVQPRKRSERQIQPGRLATVEVGELEGKRFTFLKIERNELFVNCSFAKKSRVNVCACLGEGDSREYLSACKLPGDKADFHQPGEWLGVSVIL